MEKWIDTHSHYNAKQIYKEDTIEKALKTSEKIITLGTSASSNLETLDLVSKFKEMYGMIGFFPNNAFELEADFVGKKKSDENWMLFTEQLLNYSKIIGIGEIGLDCYHNSFGRGKNQIKGPKAIEYQIKYFKKQLNYAKDLQLPVSLHSRDAKELTTSVFKEYDRIKGVMHCFSYDIKTVSEYLEKGLYIGVGGTITYNGNDILREAIKEVPLNRILLETDAPYLTPVPYRHKINDSSYIKYIIKYLAELKNVSEEKIIEQTNKNVKDLFHI